MTRRICLVSTGQPSTNPRLVKEADALCSAGYDVRVVGAYSADWAIEADRELMATRRWPLRLVDWRMATSPAAYRRTRVRHYVARLAGRYSRVPLRVAEAAVSRVTPELRRAASRVPADLYIAHNLGALPAAAAAAEVHGARVAFDAEDFHAGQWAREAPMRRLTEQVERAYLPRCAYLTAAAPGIADAYAPLSASGSPRVVRNVFPLVDRPPAQRALPADGPVTMYWCSQTIGPHRGLEDAVRAMARLAPDAVTLHLRGTWASGYERTLRALAEGLGLAPGALCAHDMAPPQDMVRLAWNYDIGLSLETGSTENSQVLLSNKIFTCLLAGLAIIATSTSGQAQLLGSCGPAARCYAPGDADAMARVLSEWMRDRPALGAARAAAWALGESTFNWDLEQRALLSVVDAVFAS